MRPSALGRRQRHELGRNLHELPPSASSRSCRPMHMHPCAHAPLCTCTPVHMHPCAHAPLCTCTHVHMHPSTRGLIDLSHPWLLPDRVAAPICPRTCAAHADDHVSPLQRQLQRRICFRQPCVPLRVFLCMSMESMYMYTPPFQN
jgi:hypothetical protein